MARIKRGENNPYTVHLILSKPRLLQINSEIVYMKQFQVSEVIKQS